jgi:hypothetical protein
MLFVRLGYLALLVGAAVSLAACGDSSDTPGAAGTGSGGNAGTGGSGAVCTDCAHPPDPAAGAPEGDGTGQIFAIRSLDLGKLPADAWKAIGYDIDGKKSTSASTDHCKLVGEGTPARIKADGLNGIDNSFGGNVMEALPDETQGKIDDAMKAGEFTILIQIDKLGSGKDYVNLPAFLYAGAARTGADPDAGAVAPTWDGTDEWPVFCELMQTCNESGTPQISAGNKSKVQFLNSYVNQGTWVSGLKGEGTLNLALSIAGFNLALTVHNAIISAQLGSESPLPTTGANGVVSGVLKTDEVINSLGQMAGKLNTSWCESSALDSFVDQVRAASDILVDGTQDAAKDCDGISIGLGFTMGAAKIEKVLDKAPPSPDPCAEADAGQ